MRSLNYLHKGEINETAKEPRNDITGHLAHPDRVDRVAPFYLHGFTHHHGNSRDRGGGLNPAAPVNDPIAGWFYF